MFISITDSFSGKIIRLFNILLDTRIVQVISGRQCARNNKIENIKSKN